MQEVIKNFKEPSVTKIGEIGGFDINFRLVNLYRQKSGAMEVIQRQVAITLMNHGTYKVNANSVSGIEYILRNAPDNFLKSDTAELEKSQAKLSELEKQLDKTFAQQVEMEETRSRLEEIDAEINNVTPVNQDNENITQTVAGSDAEKSAPSENVNTAEQNSFKIGTFTTAKNSQTRDGSTVINNLVDAKNLTDQHKLLQKFGKTMDANVVFFSNYNRDFHGAYEGGTIYLNVNSALSLTTTFAHELFHFLKANNPKLFSEMAKAAGITESQLANYLAETKRTDVTKTADVTEEMIADAMQQILSRVAKKNPNLIQRFLAWLKDTFQKFKDLFQNPKGKLTRGQYAKLADTFGKMAVKLTDADGNKLFRYNTRTHNLELADGESFETLLDDNEKMKALMNRAFLIWTACRLPELNFHVTMKITRQEL